jgi:putative transposase
VPRQLRLWHPNAIYHVFSRGNRRTPIFLDSQDYISYLSILEETKIRFPFTLHAYCLMENHYHLLIETKNAPISKIMHRINFLYAMNFNRKYGKDGHVFQGRYGSKMILSPNHFLFTSRYIHLNPFFTTNPISPYEYAWSSCRAYIFNEENLFIQKESTERFFLNDTFYTHKMFLEVRMKESNIYLESRERVL